VAAISNRQPPEEFRLALVGCGRLAELGYLPALALARGVRLVAVADPDRSRCEAVAPTLPAYESAEALIEGEDVGGLVLATPAGTHLQDARIAAAAGLATLVEKPPARNVEEASALAELRPPSWTGFNRRFDGGLKRMRAAVPAGADVDLHLELRYRRAAWGAYVVADDALEDLGSHLVDLARWLSGGEVECARAVELGPSSAHVELELERGRARIVCASDRGHRERFVLRNTTGRVLARRDHDRPRGALRRLRHPRAANSLVATLAQELEAFARAARSETLPHPATANDGLAVMATLEAARRSAVDGGGWQTVRLPGSGG